LGTGADERSFFEYERPEAGGLRDGRCATWRGVARVRADGATNEVERFAGDEYRRHGGASAGEDCVGYVRCGTHHWRTRLCRGSHHPVVARVAGDGECRAGNATARAALRGGTAGNGMMCRPSINIQDRPQTQRDERHAGRSNAGRSAWNLGRMHGGC
jgi:hypothetical protein